MFLDQPYHQTRMLLLDGLCSATRVFFLFFFLCPMTIFLSTQAAWTYVSLTVGPSFWSRLKVCADVRCPQTMIANDFNNYVTLHLE